MLFDIHRTGAQTANVCEVEVFPGYDVGGKNIRILGIDCPKIPMFDEVHIAFTINAPGVAPLSYSLPRLGSLVDLARYLNDMTTLAGVSVFDAFIDGNELSFEVLIQSIDIDPTLAELLGLPAQVTDTNYYYTVLDPEVLDVSWGYEVSIRGLGVTGYHDGLKHTTRVGFARRDQVVKSEAHRINTHNHSFIVSVRGVDKDLTTTPIPVANTDPWSIRFSID